MTGNEAQARQAMVEALLRTLQHGAAGRRWQAVADGVLDGSFTLREAAESPAFRELFHEAAARLNDHRAAVGDTVVEADRDQANRVFTELAEHPPHDSD